MKISKIVMYCLLLLSSLFISAQAAMIGDTAYIVTSMNYPHVAIDEAGFEAYMKALATNDIPHGVTELYQKRKLFQVENNVKVRILDKGFTKIKVRILEGKMQGSSGWVASEWIKDQPSGQNSSTGLKLNCSKVKFANTFPDSIPKGFNRGQKTKYRVVDSTTDEIVIMDTNKIGNPSDCQLKMYAPVYFQEYSFEGGFRGMVKKRWYHRTVRDNFDLLLYDGKSVAIIQK